jgi:endonuclease/exonuclease/phosphatase family metal-dependent hydrolase
MSMRRMLTALAVVATGFLTMSQNGIEVENDAAVPAYHSNHDSTLTLVTYNIRGCRDDEGEAEALAIAEELKKLGADIIALQEVDNRLPRSHFVNQAKTIARHLEMNYAYAPSIDFSVGTFGNAVISAFPIVSAQAVGLPFEWEPRTLLEVTLDLNGTPFHIYTTHLGLKKSERIKQFKHLHDYLREKTGKSAVLLGDFNTRPGDPLLAPLRTLLHDPLHARHQELVTISGSSTYGMIDHVLLSPDLRFRYAFSMLTGRSDHYPLLFELDMPKPRGGFEQLSKQKNSFLPPGQERAFFIEPHSPSRDRAARDGSRNPG